MPRLIARRLFFMVFVVWGVTLITFFLSRVAPGDPARLIAGPHANAAAVEHIRMLYGLDKPLPVQYWRYMADLLHGNLGVSFVTRQPVLSDIRAFLPATLELSAYALVVGSVIGIVFGVVAAVRRASAADTTTRFAAMIGLSLPAFWIAMLFQIGFYSKLGWLPFGGRLSTGAVPPTHLTGFYTVDALITLRWLALADALRHLALPVLTLALGEIGLMTRIVRTSMLEVLDEDYIRTATAKGVSRRSVLVRHALRTALLPAVTVIGLEFGLLAGGVFLVETIFAWPGIGRYAYDAIRASDYNATMGVTLVIALIYVALNLVIDVVYLYLDPRIRYT